MAKPFAKLASIDFDELRGIPESGMGYYIAMAHLNGEATERAVIVTSDRIVPAYHSELTSIQELWRTGETFPSLAISGVALSGVRSAASVAFPPGYVATPGAVPLLGTYIAAAGEKFYRLLSSTNDHRFVGSNLLKDTYLTTTLDRAWVNTGFGAVGRYALPLPVPASYVIEYTLVASTTFDVGTVLPNFGQAGGGVEVKTTAPVPAVQTGVVHLPDC